MTDGPFERFEIHEIGDPRQAKQSTLAFDEAIRCVRAICAHELDRPYDYPFFQADYLPGEHPDDALVRLFVAERANHGSDFYTVLVLCHG
jgi:hypothetical protein